jgi:hypothetical protein
LIAADNVAKSIARSIVPIRYADPLWRSAMAIYPSIHRPSIVREDRWHWKAELTFVLGFHFV